MNIKKNIIVTLIIGFFIIISPIILILYKFHNHNISSEMIDWANLGNYLSGTVEITISIVNLVLLVILSLYVAKLDMHRHFNEFKYASYIKLCEKFDKVEDTSKSYTDLLEFLESFVSRNSFTYSKKDYILLKQNTNELIEAIKEIIKYLKNREIAIEKGDCKEFDVKETYFSGLITDSIWNNGADLNPDLVAYNKMKQKRENLIAYIQDKMKINK